VLISGASTGIGEATALRLAGSGYTVYAGVRKESDGNALAAKSNANLRPVLLDVTDAASIDAALEMVSGEVGERGLVGLVNNAGISGGAPLEFADLADVRRMFEVNVFGLLALTQAFMPLIRRGHGRVVCTGSIGGRIGAPFVGSYGASKAAVSSLCDSLRVEVRPWGIQVVLVEPGSIATPIWEKGLTAFDAKVAEMPPEMTRLYGGVIETLRKRTMETAARGIPPARVADVVHRALTANRPRTRYLVGRDARVQAAVRRLPDRARDALISRLLSIPSAPPS
jgi:NAD(P)-dependent dehydrogenase (short-subunit alcohol dehydrogenase family)